MSSLTRIKVVSWDVDGTLYSMPRLRIMIALLAAKRMTRGWREARDVRVELSELQKVRKYISTIRLNGGILSNLGPLSDRDRITRIERRWYGEAIRRIGVTQLAMSLIERIARAGVQQVIASDFYSDYKIKALGLEGKFSRIYAGEAMGFVKPNANMFRMISESLGIDPSNILHIGDMQERDGVAASGAGFQVAIIGKDNEFLTQYAEKLSEIY